LSEKVLCLPDCYQPNTRRQISDIEITRADQGLPESGTVFCCFNQIQKISPEIFTVWMRILSRVPNSVLWLLTKNAIVADDLRREAAVRGVDTDRLIFATPLALPEHLKAHTTASDALWAGIPILTLEGNTFAGASLEVSSRVPGSQNSLQDLLKSMRIWPFP
jgi:protein O-GlcNAc transferase